MEKAKIEIKQEISDLSRQINGIVEEMETTDSNSERFGLLQKELHLFYDVKADLLMDLEKLLEDEKTKGRPRIGTTKKVSMTLPDADWEMLEEIARDHNITQSALLREIIQDHCDFIYDEMYN